MEETKKMWHPNKKGPILNPASSAFHCSHPKNKRITAESNV
jgi:hypothetical protein